MTDLIASAPVADRRPQDRTHHGDTFADPYEWLRDKDDAEVRELFGAEFARIATSLAVYNVQVIASAPLKPRWEKLEAAIPWIGGGIPFVADASDPDRLAELPAEVEAELGGIDILVLNTGGPPFGGALEHEREATASAARTFLIARTPCSTGDEPTRRGRRALGTGWAPSGGPG